jgi:hypothetical protein
VVSSISPAPCDHADLPIWQVDRAIGVGSDRVVEILTGEQVEKGLGGTLRAAAGPLYLEMIDDASAFGRANK